MAKELKKGLKDGIDSKPKEEPHIEEAQKPAEVEKPSEPAPVIVREICPRCIKSDLEFEMRLIKKDEHEEVSKCDNCLFNRSVMRV